jgi:Tol biopolymer transport system component
MSSKAFRFVAALAISVLLAFPLVSFVALAAAGDVTRVSVDTSEAQANAISYNGQISSNGRFAVFESEATNLVSGDTNGVGDVFLRDLQLGTTIRVSVNSTGGQADGGGGAPAVSSDGRYVAFESGATDLILGDTNNAADIYVKDTQTGSIERVSVDSSGTQSNGDSSAPSISGDGRYVAFVSSATNLIASDVNGVDDVFLRDMQSDTTVRVSVSANGASWDPTVANGGGYVVFSSNASNLIPGDTNGKTDIFVYEISAGQLTRVSVNSNEEEGDRASWDASISGDGRYISFSSASHNFMLGDTYELTYVYIRDRLSGNTNLASIQNGAQMIGWADATSMSADGRYVAFSYDDKGDGMPKRWLYVHDRITGQTVYAISGTMDGMGNPILPSISGDGKMLLFASASSTLVSGDTNNVRDIFVKEMAYPADANPFVVSIIRTCPALCSPSDQAVHFTVRFSEPVTGVDAADFDVDASDTMVGAAVTGVGGNGSEYDVTVDVGTGDGALRLDLIDNDSIKDAALHPLGGNGLNNGNFSGAAIYIVDKKPMTVSSILRMDANPTAGGDLRFAVKFSEPASGVDAADFLPVTTGTLSAPLVAGVTQLSASSYAVTVSTGPGLGTLRLDVPSGATALDLMNHSLSSLPYTSGESYTINKSATFYDVPSTYWAWEYIERLFNAGITAGCGSGKYCPDDPVTRAQMAVFLLRGIHGSNYTPPDVGTDTGFTDVATNHWAAAWIKQLGVEAITGGCGQNLYCPENSVTRAQMAVFLLKSEHGTSYLPPDSSGAFGDIAGHWAEDWIAQLALEGITAGCGSGLYCPENPVTRAQMAVFLVRAFQLP